MVCILFFFFFKQKTAYEMRISDWSSDVCSSDLFAQISAWPVAVNLWATALPLAFFALAIGGYVLHGLLDDTDNQFRRPHAMGALRLPKHGLAAFMVLLVIAEIGGFVVL